MTREEKAERMVEIRSNMCKTHSHLVRAERVYRKMEKRWLCMRNEYERLDYELALTDERFERIKRKKQAVKQELSIAQIMQLAELLNIKVDIGKAVEQIEQEVIEPDSD